MVRVAVYAFPIAFLLANAVVPALPIIMYFLFSAIWRSCVLEFLSVVLLPPAWRPLRKVFGKVLGPIVYEAQYWRDTFYYCISIGKEYLGRFLLRCYLRYVLEKEGILWGNTIKDFKLLRYKLKIQVVHLWRSGLRDPVVGWVLWYLRGQVNFWRYSLLKGFFYVCEEGAL